MPKIVDHEVYQDELLSKVFPVLTQRGYACPIWVVAKEIGVSTGTLYHYFPNKRALFESLAEFMAKGQIAAAEAMAGSDLTSGQLFTQMTDMVYAARAEITGLILLSVDIMRQEDSEEMRKFFHKYFNTYAKALTRLLCINRDLAHMIIACADGLLLHGFIHADDRVLKQRLRLFADMVQPWLQNGGEGHNA